MITDGQQVREPAPRRTADDTSAGATGRPRFARMRTVVVGAVPDAPDPAQQPAGDDTADQRRLPGDNADLWDWQMKGLCRGGDSSLFDPNGERGPARAQREAQAKLMCGRCPVMQQCRQLALAVQEPFGTWGGLDEIERAILVSVRQRQARGRSGVSTQSPG